MAKVKQPRGTEKAVNPTFKNKGPKGKLTYKDVSKASTKPGKKITKTK